MDEKLICYVGSCPEPTVIGANHKLFGAVVACLSHNPIKHGYALPLDLLTPAGTAVTLSELVQMVEASRNGGNGGSGGSGGSKVPRIPIVPPIAPVGDELRELETVDNMF